MRILIASQYYHPAYDFGGTVTNAVAIAEGLQSIGHEVFVVTTNVINSNQRPNRHSWKEVVNGVSVYYFGTWLSLNKSHVNPEVFWFARSKLRDFDALHIIGLYDSLGTILASFAKRYRIPYSVEPSGMLSPNGLGSRLKKVYQILVGDRLFRNARAIVVTSAKEKRDIFAEGYNTVPCLLRYNGVDLRPYKTLPLQGKLREEIGIASDLPLLLWMGRIEPIKNLEQLFVGLSQLQDIPWHLALIGPVESEEYFSSLHSSATDLGILPRLHFVSPRYGEQKISAFVDADVVVLVSNSENWGNTIQEAIATGVPVLVTDTCGVAEVVEGRGGLVVKKDANAIAEGIRSLLLNEDLYHDFKAQLPALAADLSWDKPIQQMSTLIQSWTQLKNEK